MHVHTLTDKFNKWQTTFQKRSGQALAQEYLRYKTLNRQTGKSIDCAYDGSPDGPEYPRILLKRILTCA